MKRKTSIKPLETEILKTQKKNKVEKIQAMSLIYEKHISKAKTSVNKAIFALMKLPKTDKRTLEKLRKIQEQLTKRNSK